MPSDQTLVMPVQGRTPDYRHVAQVVGRDLGVEGWGSAIEHVSFSSSSQYAHTIRNRGTGGHINVLKSTDGTSMFRVTDAGVFMDTLTVTTLNAGTVNATTANVGTVNATTINATVANLNAINATSITTRVLTVATSGAATFNVPSTFGNSAQYNSNVQMGTSAGTFLFLLSKLQMQNPAGTQITLFGDPGNNRVIIGSDQAMGSDTTPALQVRGRLYVGPDSANDQAIQWRRSAAATAGWWLGEASDGRSVFKDQSANTILNIGGVSATYQMDLLGASRFQGTMLASTGDLTLTAGNINLANLRAVRMADTGGTQRSVLLINGSNYLAVSDNNINTTLLGANIGFFGSGGNSKQTVTGSRGGNAALASLLTALAAYGLVTDSSS